jgi:hypothetical protein
MKSMKAGLFALLAIIPAACLAFPPSLEVHELLIVLPPAPAAWASLPELRMTISWRDPKGRPSSSQALPGSSRRIEVERGFHQAILARPSSSGRPLGPAGALYPEAIALREPGREADELLLDWRGGYAASIALALEGEGFDPCRYDLYRLVDGALARSGDPWLLSPLEAARRLAALDFRIDLYDEGPRWGVLLPGSGPWAPESPFAAEAGGSASLPEGIWRFLALDEELLVSVDSAGRAATILY